MKQINLTNGKMNSQTAEGIEQVMQSLPGETVSFKVRSRATGMGEVSIGSEILSQLTGSQQGTGANGSITFKYTREFATNNIKEIQGAIEKLHGWTQKSLREMMRTCKVSEESARKIIKQRKAFLEACRILRDDHGLTISDDVRADVMKKARELGIVSSSQNNIYESTIILGDVRFNQEDTVKTIKDKNGIDRVISLGYKIAKIYQRDDKGNQIEVDAYVRSSNTYGTKRCPISSLGRQLLREKNQQLMEAYDQAVAKYCMVDGTYKQGIEFMKGELQAMIEVAKNIGVDYKDEGNLIELTEDDNNDVSIQARKIVSAYLEV